KFVADAMGGACSAEINGSSWLDALTFDTSTSQGNTNAVAYGYTYVQIPKATVYGTGLCEAPRGALGHWIKIQNKKIANYQCVVPSTWNNGPRGSSYSDLGVAESVLYGLKVCDGDPTSNTTLQNEAALNIARMLHPYDFCTACAVHVVSPEGKELVKFTFDPDGKIMRI
ncbi:MAG: nickel-dependent hydrogenase large subunit, partial [Nitrospirae bacterium]|nr:nickel-dependent hydrogenase large subunit [Nitrospirota bacterium]